MQNIIYFLPTVIQHREYLIIFQSPDDTNHCIRVAFGNGLRRDIWREFRDRFNIPIIGEFYAATEGNAGFINHMNKFGAIGRSSPVLVSVNVVIQGCNFNMFLCVMKYLIKGLNFVIVEIEIQFIYLLRPLFIIGLFVLHIYFQNNGSIGQKKFIIIFMIFHCMYIKTSSKNELISYRK